MQVVPQVADSDAVSTVKGFSFVRLAVAICVPKTPEVGDVCIEHLTVADEYARAEYLKSLDEVDTERRARILDRAREEYRRRNGRDIERVENLLAGPEPVLRELPAELHGWEWTIDAESGRIVSSFYGKRYEVHFQGGVRPFAEPPAAQKASG